MADSLNLGEIYAKLSVNYSDLHLAELAARNFAQKTKSQFEDIAKTGEKIAGVGKKLTASITMPIVGAGVASLKFAQDFDTSMREVNSLLDDSAKDFEGLKGQVRGVSLALGIDLVKAGNAAYEAIGAGVPKDNLVEFLNVSGKASIGGVTDIKVAVDGLTTVTNAWGKSAGSTAQIADQMFTAVKYGKVTFDQMAASIFQVGSLGPELGVSFKEVAAASALLTAQGVPQSVAMTQMRAAMSALMGPNEEMTKLLKAAGVQSVKTAVSQKGLAGTYDLLRKTAAKNHISLEKSVGSVEALGFVLKTTGKNAEGFKTALDQVNNSAGATEAAFKEMQKARGFDVLVNDLKALATVVGDVLMPIILPIVEGLTQWIKKGLELDPALVKIAVGFGAVAAAVGPVLLAIGSAVAAIAPMIASAGGLGAALGSLAAMAGPVGLAVAAIVAAGYTLYKNWDTVKDFVVTLVQDIIGWFQKWASDNAGLIDSIKASWDEFVAAGSALFTTLWNAISKFVTDTIESLDQLLEPIGGLKGAWELLKTGVGEALTAMGQFLKDFLDGATVVFTAVDDWLKNGPSLWETFKAGIKAATTAIVSYILELPAKLTELKATFIQVFNEITAYLKNINWRQIGSDIVNGLKQGIIAAKDSAVNAVKEVGDAITEGAREAFDTHSPSRVFADIGKDLMAGLGLGINDNLQGVISSVVFAADQVISTAKEKLSAEELHKQLVDTTRGQLNDLTKSTYLDGQDNNYELQLAKEQAYYDKSLALLQKAEELKIASIRPYNELREQMEVQHQEKLIAIQRSMVQSTQQSLDATLGSLREFGAEQTGIYKTIFAVSKAFAIADAMLAMSQNIANASKVGFPYNIPFIAGAVAQGASIIASVQSIAGQFNNGGNIAAGQVGLVAETGRPELVNGVLVGGPANVTSSQKTHELLNGGGGPNTNVYVEVLNYGEANVQVEQSGDNEEKRLRIIIDRVKDSIAADAYRGDGPVDMAFSQKFGLQRKMA